VSTPGQKKGIFSQRAAQRTKAVIALVLDLGGLSHAKSVWNQRRGGV
jgi:hypothetical protein